MTKMDLPSLQLQSCSHLSLGMAGTHFTPFCSCDLDLGPTIFIYELDLNPLKIYPQTINERIMLQTDSRQKAYCMNGKSSAQRLEMNDW